MHALLGSARSADRGRAGLLEPCQGNALAPRRGRVPIVPRPPPLDVYTRDLATHLKTLDREIPRRADPVAAAIAHVAKHTSGERSVGPDKKGATKRSDLSGRRCRLGDDCRALAISKAILEGERGSLGETYARWRELARPFHHDRRRLETAIDHALNSLGSLAAEGRRAHEQTARYPIFVHEHHLLCELPRVLREALERTLHLLRSARDVWLGAESDKKPADKWSDRIAYPLHQVAPNRKGDDWIANVLLRDGGPREGANGRARSRRRRLLPTARGRGRPRGSGKDSGRKES